jgi:hypothetical protein
VGELESGGRASGRSNAGVALSVVRKVKSNASPRHGNHLSTSLSLPSLDRGDAHDGEAVRLEHGVRVGSEHERRPADVGRPSDLGEGLAVGPDEEELDVRVLGEGVEDGASRVDGEMDDGILLFALEELWHESSEHAQPRRAPRPIDQRAPLCEPALVRPVLHLVQTPVAPRHERPPVRHAPNVAHPDAVRADGEIGRVERKVGTSLGV